MSLAKIILSNISQCFFLSLTKISSYIICTMYLSRSERFSAFYSHCGPLILCSTPSVGSVLFVLIQWWPLSVFYSQWWIHSLYFTPVLTPYSVFLPQCWDCFCDFIPCVDSVLSVLPLCWFHYLSFTPQVVMSALHGSSSVYDVGILVPCVLHSYINFYYGVLEFLLLVCMTWTVAHYHDGYSLLKPQFFKNECP